MFYVNLYIRSFKKIHGSCTKPDFKVSMQHALGQSQPKSYDDFCMAIN